MKKLILAAFVLVIVLVVVIAGKRGPRVEGAERAHHGPKSAQDMGTAFGKAIGGLIAGGGNR